MADLKAMHRRAKSLRKEHPRMSYREAFKKAAKNSPRRKIGAVKKKTIKRAPVRRTVRKTASKMQPVQRVTTVTEKALIGEIKTRVLGTIGRAYEKMIVSKTKREKKVYAKIIADNKKKLRKLS